MRRHFKLAKAVLEEQGEQALTLFKKLCKSEKLDKSVYREWPLFREFRKNEEFQRLFQEFFEEPLIVEMEGKLGIGSASARKTLQHEKSRLLPLQTALSNIPRN